MNGDLLHQNGLVEPYRALHGRTLGRAGERPVRTLLFTASYAREGCSTVAANLAVYASQVEPHRVLLLELDVLHPPRDPIVPVARKAGLSDVLAGKLSLEEAIQRVPGTPLHVLGSGTIRQEVPSLHSEAAIGELLQRLRREYHYVIADGPTIDGMPPVLPLLRHFDGVVLVAEANRTRRQVVAHNVERLKSTGGNFLGVVMNRRRYFIPGWIYGRL